MIKKLIPKRLKQKLLELRVLFFRAIRHLKGNNKTRDDILRLTEPGYHLFFGYYDVSPFSLDGTKILAIRLPCKSPAKALSAEVGYYDLGDGDNVFKRVGKTAAWNWQQGCRLRWFSEDTIIYNVFEDGAFKSIHSSLTGERLAVYDRAFYDIDGDRKWGLSLDFVRLQRLRPGYGYSCLPDRTRSVALPENNGIWRTNLETGKTELILTLEDIAAQSPLQVKGVAGEEHYINHLCFSPSGSRFLFFHLRDIGGKRESRLMVCDCDGGNLRCVSDKMNISHYSWKNDDEILGTGKFDQSGVQYRLFNIANNESSAVAPKVLRVDGHPSWFKDRSRFITDTYPDALYSERKLYIYDTEKQVTTELCSFFSPLSLRGERRCDLHPRLCHREERVCVDIAEKKRREIAIVPLANKGY